MVQTDNTYLADKVMLRAGHLPEKKTIRVLDAYGGKGLVWAGVEKITGRKIFVLPIDLKKIGFALPGDNRIYLESLDLNRFDVIDLDAYGVPYDQLKIVFDNGYKGHVFVTFIQSVMGTISYSLLEEIGFTKKMIKKCPTVFGQSGWQYFLEFLALRGVSRIWHRSRGRKHYLYFNCTE